MGPLTISAIHWGRSRGLGQNGGYIAAAETSTGRELWVLKVYDTPYDPRREQDVQDVFIVEMKATDSGSLLEIHDEEGRVFLVDPTTRSVQPR
jgi:hypothetical protein